MQPWDTNEDICALYNKTHLKHVIPSDSGVGETVARRLFDGYKGRWELTIVETNEDALHFWRAVLTRHTGNRFIEQHRPEERDFLHAFQSGESTL